MKILLGSKNPVKIEAAKEAFEKYYRDVNVIAFDVDSKVGSQPFGEDTYAGAENRARSLLIKNSEEKINADYFVGIEGGIKNIYNKWFAFGCVCILDKYGNAAFGTSPQFELPNEVLTRLVGGEELGHVIDSLQGQKNTKQKQGAIGFFTGGVMQRKDFYIPGVICALVPFRQPEFFFDDKTLNTGS